ncbi:hypothetical protein Pyn_20850 [Prunus yedoensis var. nudiflora]|uniref:Uncharacterized protein n=1 Tax=Prunus yedoensis var. nudiflora TaxID=2094558 RepID=A0A314Z6S8_PRUYE|nr:hypothetical protein Pyn_20850 [Prunus yedoensis var. nudiflora]
MGRWFGLSGETRRPLHSFAAHVEHAAVTILNRWKVAIENRQGKQLQSPKFMNYLVINWFVVYYEKYCQWVSYQWAAEEPLGHTAAIITDVLENAETNHVVSAVQKQALV